MRDQAHVIEIDSIVLTGVNHLRPERLTALIEAEVQRLLSGAGFSAATGVADSEGRVAGDAARSVVQSVQGGPDGT